MERNKWYIAQTPSTNQALKDWLRNSPNYSHGVLYTDLQTEGRGQRGNRWESEVGQNLLCSFVVNELKNDQAHSLNMAAMWAVHRTLEHFGVLESKVKWPNDILVLNRKVSGILVENTFEGDRLKQAIVGIGLNVNQVRFDLDKVASMRMLTGKEFTLELVLDQLYDRFYEALDRPTRELLNDLNKILYGQGEMLKFAGETGLQDYLILGLTANGELEVEGPDGKQLLQHPRHRLVS